MGHGESQPRGDNTQWEMWRPRKAQFVPNLSLVPAPTPAPRFLITKGYCGLHRSLIFGGWSYSYVIDFTKNGWK